MIKERDFKGLIEMIQRHERVKLRVEIVSNKQMLSLNSQFGDKVFQFSVMEDSLLVIQALNFRHQRKGLGSSVLEELKTYAKNNNLTKIQIQNGDTFPIVEFAKKNGFKPVDSEVYYGEDGNLYGNYLLSLNSELSQ